MRIAIEEVFLVNFLTDAFLLICCLRSMRLIRSARILAAAFSGACISSILVLLRTGWLFQFLIAGLSIPLILFIACGSMSIRAFVKSCNRLLSAGAICAAFSCLLNIHIPLWLCAAMGFICTWSICDISSIRHSAWEAQAEIIHNGKKCRFGALIDTGNRLREPISGLDVMIVSAEHLAPLLPHILDPADPWRTLPDGFRLVSFGSVGGSGEMACFMPDDLHFRLQARHKSKKDEIWIAVYPGTLPGGVSALAPASVLQ